MLIGVAVWDTEENGRTDLTRQTLESLARTVDWGQHRLIVSDNGSCKATLALYREMVEVLPFKVIYNGENLGTAAAINRAWRYREPGESAVKMDNDVLIHQPDWVDWMEDVFRRDGSIGICGLKRKDLAECPWSENPWYESTIRMLPHEPGQRWLVVEEVAHVMGTVQAYSGALLEKIGFLYQMQDLGNKYGLDDSLASVRAHLAGFKTAFLHGFEIDHLDVSNPPDKGQFTEWKRRNAKKWLEVYHRIIKEYEDGTRPLYWEDADVSGQ